jgi:hypothetical protein
MGRTSTRHSKLRRSRRRILLPGDSELRMSCIVAVTASRSCRKNAQPVYSQRRILSNARFPKMC